MDSKVCMTCKNEVTAEIKDLHQYDRRNIPVWYCSRCDLSVLVFKKDRHLWVSKYDWDPPGLIYGNRAHEYTHCPGCRHDSMVADTCHLINEVFPFYEALEPSWTCHRCSFSDKVVKEDGILWSDMFTGWL